MKLFACFTLWFFASLAFALSGQLQNLPPEIIPVMIWTPAIIGFFWFGHRSRLHTVTTPHALTIILLYHGIIRLFFGGYFLFDYTQGNLIGSFAIPAGIGDIIAGVAALAIIAMKKQQVIQIMIAWNIFAFLDILGVFANAQRLLIIEQDMTLFENFAALPYPMLPTIVVPIIMMTHLLLTKHLWNQIKRTKRTANQPIVKQAETH